MELSRAAGPFFYTDTALNFNQDHFQLFGLPRRFAVDMAALDERYRELQREVHPDRFATGSDAEKRLSVQRATLINEAYQTLKAPLSRVRYLLESAGIDAAIETNTAMPADFLMQQMEWRESLEEAGESSNPAQLDALELRLQKDMTELYAVVEGQLDRGEGEAASGTLRKLMFLEKLREDIGDAYERMES